MFAATFNGGPWNLLPWNVQPSGSGGTFTAYPDPTRATLLPDAAPPPAPEAIADIDPTKAAILD